MIMLLRYLALLAMLFAWPAHASYTDKQYDNFYLVRQQVSGDMFYIASAVMMRETQAGEYPFLIDQIHKHRPIRYQSFGLMQVQVGTARHMMAVYNYGNQAWSDTYIANKLLRDKEFNIKTGVLYLTWLQSIGLSKEEMITAYNIGPGRYHLIQRPAKFRYTKYVLDQEIKLRNDPVIWDNRDFRTVGNGSEKHLAEVLAMCNKYNNSWYICDIPFIAKIKRMYAASIGESNSLESMLDSQPTMLATVSQSIPFMFVPLAIRSRRMKVMKSQAALVSTWVVFAWLAALYYAIHAPIRIGFYLVFVLLFGLVLVAWLFMYKYTLTWLQQRHKKNQYYSE